MLHNTIILCFFLVCFVDISSGQQLKGPEEPRFVAVPSDQVLVTIAYQPESSLQFERVKYVAEINRGGGSPGFIVRNNGEKPVRSFTVGGPDWTISWSYQVTKRLLMPGEIAEPCHDVEIVGLSKELIDKLNLNGPMKSILVLMVVRVEFADGSTYSADHTYRALQGYSERLADLTANTKLQVAPPPSSCP